MILFRVRGSIQLLAIAQSNKRDPINPRRRLHRLLNQHQLRAQQHAHLLLPAQTPLSAQYQLYDHLPQTLHLPVLPREQAQQKTLPKIELSAILLLHVPQFHHSLHHHRYFRLFSDHNPAGRDQHVHWEQIQAEAHQQQIRVVAAAQNDPSAQRQRAKREVYQRDRPDNESKNDVEQLHQKLEPKE